MVALDSDLLFVYAAPCIPWRMGALDSIGLGFRVEGLGLRVEGLGLRVEGLGLRVWGFRVWGFRV